MKNSKKPKSKSVPILLAMTFIALIFPLGLVGALAADTDGDGFDEVSGISLPPNMKLAATGGTFLPVCSPTVNVPRNLCVREGEKDLFVIVDRAPSGGNIPSPGQSGYVDPLSLISAGLGVITHELAFTAGTQDFSQAIGGHYAVRIKEDLNPAPPRQLMGLATFGVPYAGSLATVWTEWIKIWIAQKCSKACFTNSKTGATTCYTPVDDNDGSTVTARSFECRNMTTGTVVNMASIQSLDLISKEFIQNIVSHEVSHMIHLAYGADTFDHHYPIAAGVLMEQFVDVKATVDRSANVDINLYISTGYTKADKSSVLLY